VKPSDRWRARLVPAVGLSLALGVLGIGLFGWWRGGLGDLAAIGRIGPAGIAAATMLLAVSHGSGGLRLLVLARAAGTPVAPWHALRAYLLGLVSAAVTPSGGGHALAMAWALRRAGVPGATAWAVSLYTTVLDLAFYAWALPLALVVWASAAPPASRWVLVVAMPVGLALLAAGFLLAYRLPWLRRPLGRLFSLPWLRRWRRAALRFVDRFALAMTTLNAMGPRTVIGLQGVTLVQHAAVYLVLCAIAERLGADPAWIQVVAVAAVASAVANLVPTPGASGYMELTLSLALARHVEPNLIAPSVLAWRAFAHYASLVLGSAVAGSMWRAEAGRAAERPRRRDVQPPHGRR
jgi:glycosyltransferase 2 family protein